MRERMVISIFLAILVHFVLLLVLQLVLRLEQTRIPEYTGPLYVTLGETPDVAPVIEKAQEPKQLPRMEEEQPKVEQKRTEPSDRAGASSLLQPLRPAPASESESVSPPRTGLRFLDPEQPPASEDPYLPPEPQAFQPPPAQTPSSSEPSPARGVPVPAQSEVRPEEQAEQSSVLNLRDLDSSLNRDDGAERSGDREGGPEAQPAAGEQSTSAREGREGIVILWDDSSQGREPTFTPKPEVPSWVSEKGIRLQVEVSFVLTPQGVLRDVRVEKGSGYSDVDAAVLEALRRWKFPPVSSDRTVTGRVPYIIIPR